MCLIYDSFHDEDQATAFATLVREETGREASVFLNRDEADKHDPFPFALHPPIVHVERLDEDDEAEREGDLAEMADRFGGVFVGT